jgi:peptide/nickel transport system permease protein
MVPVVFGVTVIAFFLLRLIPGDPTIVMLGTHWTRARAAVLRHELGLDKPLWDQYLLFMDHLVHLNFGRSIFYQLPVRTLIRQRLSVTLWLVLYSEFLALLISVPLATFTALRRNGVLDHSSRVFFVLTAAMPSFWIGLILILLFSVHWSIFPVSGSHSGFFGHLYALFLPSLTMSLGLIAIFSRTLHNAILTVLNADFIDTARVKGLSGARILTRHILRNASLSLVTVVGVTLSYAIGSTVVVEQIFNLSGLGSLLTASIYNRDLTVVQGITVVFALFVVLISLLTDIVYVVLDPRIAYD